MELKQKGASANLGAFKQLKVSLIWTSAVDLDLMAFYKTKDGRTGGVYSDNYAGGSLGDLNAFPFLQLSGDEGVGATGGANQDGIHTDGHCRAEIILSTGVISLELGLLRPGLRVGAITDEDKDRPAIIKFRRAHHGRMAIQGYRTAKFGRGQRIGDQAPVLRPQRPVLAEIEEQLGFGGTNDVVTVANKGGTMTKALDGVIAHFEFDAGVAPVGAAAGKHIGCPGTVIYARRADDDHIPPGCVGMAITKTHGGV